MSYYFARRVERPANTRVPGHPQTRVAGSRLVSSPEQGDALPTPDTAHGPTPSPMASASLLFTAETFDPSTANNRKSHQAWIPTNGPKATSRTDQTVALPRSGRWMPWSLVVVAIGNWLVYAAVRSADIDPLLELVTVGASTLCGVLLIVAQLIGHLSQTLIGSEDQAPGHWSDPSRQGRVSALDGALAMAGCGVASPPGEQAIAGDGVRRRVAVQRQALLGGTTQPASALGNTERSLLLHADDGKGANT